MPLTYRLIALIPTYAIAVWVTFYAYMGSNDLLGLVCLLLVIGGILVSVQVTWLYSVIDWKSMLASNLFILTIIGLVVGSLSQEMVRDTGLGVLAGLLASAISFWLRDMALFRPRLKLFLCYRRGDSAYITGRLRDCLARRYGSKRVFMDVDSLLPGTDFKRELSEFESKCDAVLVVIGAKWLDARDDAGNRRIEQSNDYVRLEIETSLEASVPVIPVLIQGAQLPVADQLPPSIREIVSRQVAAIRPDPDFNRDIASLTATLEGPQRKYVPRAAARNLGKLWPLSRVWAVGILLVAFLAPLGWRLLDEVTRDVRKFSKAVLSGNGKQVISLNGYFPLMDRHYGSTLRLWSLSSGQTLLKKNVRGVDMIAVSPQGGQLVVMWRWGTVEIWDADSFAFIHRLEGDDYRTWSIAWSHDGRSIALQKEDLRIALWSMDEKRVIATSEPLTAPVDTLRCSASGDKVAATLLYGKTYNFILLKKQSSRLVPVTIEHDDEVEIAAWSANGQRLAIGRAVEPYLLIYDLGATSGSPMALPHKKKVDSIVWSPVSSQLAAFGYDTVTVWDSESGKLQDEWSPAYGLGGPFASGGWSMDGAAIAIVAGVMRNEVLVWELGEKAPTVIYERQNDIDIKQVLGWSSDAKRLILNIQSSSRIWCDSKLIILGRDRDDIELVLRVGVWEGLLQKIASIFD